METNAGLDLLNAQKAQETNLCIGADVHYGKGLDVDLYGPFARPDHLAAFQKLVPLLGSLELFRGNERSDQLPLLLAGILGYYLTVIETAWESGIRVYKPQSAFYERFLPFGPMILHVLVERIHQLGRESGEPYFVELDAKRGDIDTTQGPYYDAYLTRSGNEIAPGLPGQFDFNTMTITTWMGENVVLPGLSWFEDGKGAIIVTRSSNPSGTTLQDALAVANVNIELSGPQEPFRLTAETIAAVQGLIERPPTVAEVMLYLTEKCSEDNGLNVNGISPLFNVIGSTVAEDGTFRSLRPGGVALVPGFGAQGGKFANAMAILMADGEYAGQGAIFSSSRGHNLSWQDKYGGSGDPANLRSDLQKAIARFRISEREAYQAAGIHYPYAA